MEVRQVLQLMKLDKRQGARQTIPIGPESSVVGRLRSTRQGPFRSFDVGRFCLSLPRPQSHALQPPALSRRSHVEEFRIS